MQVCKHWRAAVRQACQHVHYLMSSHLTKLAGSKRCNNTQSSNQWPTSPYGAAGKYRTTTANDKRMLVQSESFALPKVELLWNSRRITSRAAISANDRQQKPVQNKSFALTKAELLWKYRPIASPHEQPPQQMTGSGSHCGTRRPKVAGKVQRCPSARLCAADVALPCWTGPRPGHKPSLVHKSGILEPSTTLPIAELTNIFLDWTQHSTTSCLAVEK